MVDKLLRDIEAQRHVIDQRLTGPARWRGLLRREFVGVPTPAARARVASAFDTFARPPFADMPMDINYLGALHDIAVGGFDFRETNVSVRCGGTSALLRPVGWRKVLQDTEHVLRRATDGREHPVLAAARAHLELVLVHPFTDGNGRTARLLSSLLLIRAGYHSTLFTAVEQHCSENPAGYRRAFAELRQSGGRDQVAWLTAALGAMSARSRLAFLYRTGQGVPREGEPTEQRNLQDQLARITAEERDERDVSREGCDPIDGNKYRTSRHFSQ